MEDQSLPVAQPTIVSTEGLTKRFGPVWAVREVSLEVRPGEVVALIGENGSGKSTLARLIAGVLVPDAGSVLVDGRRRDFRNPSEATSAGVGLVQQEPVAAPSLAIYENVLMARLRTTAPMRRKRQIEEASALLELVGVHADPRCAFSSLGPGDRELAEVAKALASDPKVLILDEVTARLPDPERLFRLMDTVVSSGLAVLFITHRFHEIRRLADRAVVLRDGVHVGDLSQSELDDASMTRLMVGREIDNLYGRRGRELGEVALEVKDLVTDRSSAPISLEVRAAEVVGLAGLVGAGRTELIETVVGARRARAGHVAVNGRRLAARQPAHSRRAGVSLVPEDRHSQGLVLHASVTDNVALGSWRVAGWASSRREAGAAVRLIEEFDVRCPHPAAPVWTLSGGNQQKLVLGRALRDRPRVLLLDEPTRGVDIGAREEIYRLVFDAVEQGTAVLIASSDLQELIGLCDRVLVLHDGSLAGELDHHQATEERIVSLSCGGGRAA